MKIYIIGPVGSGKTTFSKKLAEKYNIKRYELDKVSWDDEHGNVKRSDEEALKIFNKILKNKSWIMEDVGREKFKQGRVDADIIYYIKLSRLGKETYNHPPTIKQFFYFISTVNSYYGKEKKKLKGLEEFSDKVVFVTKRDINKIINEDKK